MNKFRMQFEEGYLGDYEKGGGKSIIDITGYIPAEQQIMQMVNAGLRLDQQRKELYDYEGDVNDNLDLGEIHYDVTRAPNFDKADASQLANAVKARLNKQIKESKEVKEVVETPEPEVKEE